jgi:hypothetical protein
MNAGETTMPVHDWTRVDAGILHDFHLGWMAALRQSLNGSLLPEGYYALVEQHAGTRIPDVLALHAPSPGSLKPSNGTGSVALAAPRMTRMSLGPKGQRRTLTIRHVSGHHVVALIEIVSPGNKDRPKNLGQFTAKVRTALDAGVNVLLMDLFPPGPHDPQGIHDAVWDEYGESYADFPPDRPFTFVSYVAGFEVEALIEHAAVGSPLPEMPLYLTDDYYVMVPLEKTYQEAYRGVPAVWRGVIEGRESV